MYWSPCCKCSDPGSQDRAQLKAADLQNSFCVALSSQSSAQGTPAAVASLDLQICAQFVGPAALLFPSSKLRPLHFLCLPSLGETLLLDGWCLETAASYIFQVFQAGGYGRSLLRQCCWIPLWFVISLWSCIKFLHKIGSTSGPLSWFLMLEPYCFNFWDCDNL